MVMPQVAGIGLALASRERVSFPMVGQMTRSCTKFQTSRLIQSLLLVQDVVDERLPEERAMALTLG